MRQSAAHCMRVGRSLGASIEDRPGVPARVESTAKRREPANKSLRKPVAANGLASPYETRAGTHLA
jgi:hypothetical protein